MATIINHMKKAGKNAFPHHVQEVKSSADKHNARRNVHYTDQDIDKMIKMGRVFTLKELGRILNPENKGSDDDDSDNVESDKEDPPEVEEQSSTSTSASFKNRAGSALLPEPSNEPKTFITDVKIITDESAFNCDSDSNDSLDIEDREDEGMNPTLPTTLQESIRALRHALNNPNSYERVHETSYSQHTFAYKRRLRLVMPRYALPPTMAKKAGKSEIPAPRLAKKLPPLNKLGQGFRKMDAFAEMQMDMKEVEGKLHMVEANLDAVLSRPVTLKHRGRKTFVVKDENFKGKKLLQDVRETYERIQTQYTAEALDKMLGRKVEWGDGKVDSE
jgi:hypothetical protein